MIQLCNYTKQLRNTHLNLRTIKNCVFVFSILITFTILNIATQNVTEAQVTSYKCSPDSGINISKSNCFSNAAGSPVYNNTNTNNVRPPPDNNSTYVNSSN
ncbi:hypothetical protein [Candidatus Nitrosocosmicus hydrocola]|uniref:hypothetical protein n=1 Tax=Candidatus Nitrosocosmicus hydrocola TaxID=1826872 RepID=UPI0011E58A7E|nr:hypothetical protein [Candidatus Nitrosocosmicus hydrocola]